MSKINDVFLEDRSDDWLARERKRERRSSVWSFDDTKLAAKLEHEENCEAEEVEREHAVRHAAYNRLNNLPNTQPSARVNTAVRRTPTATGRNNAGKAASAIFVMVFIIIFMAFFLIAAGQIFPYGMGRMSGEIIFGLFFMVVNVIIIFAVFRTIISAFRNTKK